MMESTTLSVHALLLAERLDTRALERRGPVLPGALSLGDLPGGGRAFAFRWGAVVTIGTTLEQAEALAAQLRPHLHEPLDVPGHETAEIIIGAAEDGADEAGTILLRDGTPARLALVAKALAKSAVLTHQEEMLARTLGACLIMAVGFFFTLTPARFLVRVPLCLSCCLVELEDVVGGADHGP
ncbi:MAG: RMD1 family protein, partial [Alphaproteobacteria bacterium]